MLIFDHFPTRAKASAFAEAHGGKVYDSQEESDKVDPFPSELVPPIVLVRNATDDDNRDAYDDNKIIKSVKKFGGDFAGT